MNISIYAILLSSNLLLFAAVWHFMWRRTVLDQLRQNIFSVRDQLFYEAATGELGIGLDNGTYLEVRALLNSIIRFSHGLSLFHFGMTKANGKNAGDCPLCERIEKIPNELAKARLRETLREAYSHVTDYLFFSTLWIWPVVFLVGLGVIVVSGFSLLIRLNRKNLSLLKGARRLFVVTRATMEGWATDRISKKLQNLPDIMDGKQFA